AVFFRNQDGEVTGLRQRLHELRRIGHLAIELPPILARVLLAELGNGEADVAVIIKLRRRLDGHGSDVSELGLVLTIARRLSSSHGNSEWGAMSQTVGSELSTFPQQRQHVTFRVKVD